MSKDEMEVVSVVRRALAERLGQDRYDLWFNAGTDIVVKGTSLLVMAGNAFGVERLRKAFRENVELVARECLGPQATVHFGVSTGLVRPLVVREPLVEKPVVVESKSAVEATAPLARRPLATLETFVVGDGNRLAQAAARSVERKLGQVSPLLIHGPSGTGKSHLLEGICSLVRKTRRDRRAIQLSAEQFTSYFLEALQGSGLPMFRRKYRDVDLLLIDDVQFFAGKKATLVELQHTLDTLARGGKQVVITADRPPAELGALGSELVVRMAGGLVVGIESLDEPTRYGVLVQIAAQLNAAFPEDVLRWLAAQLPGDGRQLRGALHRVMAASEAFETPITLELAVHSTRDLLITCRRAVQLADIERAVCNLFGVTAEALHAEKRTKRLSLPRSLAMWLARKHTRSALVEIGEYFGRRSHSTVIAAHNNVERWRDGGETVSLSGGSCGINDAIKRVEAELRLA